MSRETPERTTPRSSRAATPGSRRHSKTPVRTPRRRRATIVSANLLTPRRQRRVSRTPQKTLQLLSRALARESKEASSEAAQEQEDNQPDAEPQQEGNQPKTPNFSSPGSQQHDQQSPEPFEFDFHDDKDMPDDIRENIPEDIHLYGTLNDVETRRRLSFRDSDQFGAQGLSDIALPAGIMPDDALDSGPFSDPFTQLSEPEDHIPSSAIIDATPPNTENHDNEIPTQKIQVQKLNSSKPKASYIRRSKEFGVKNNRKLQKYAQTYTKRRLSKESLTTLNQTSDEFFNQISLDLSAYTNHSKNKETLSIKSVYLLLKRQRQISSVKSLLELADEYLPLEDMIEIQRNLHKLQK